GSAYLKAQYGAGNRLPREGTVFISVNDHDKEAVVSVAARLRKLGFNLTATRGTRDVLARAGVDAEFVYKVEEGRPNIVDQIKSNKISLVINTPLGKLSFYDERAIRSAATQYNVPCITTLTGAQAVVSAIESLLYEELTVTSIQECHYNQVEGR